MAVPRTKTALRALLGAHGLQPAKMRGQHFLVDPNLIDFIVRSSGVGPGDNVLEVGTGTAILTDALERSGAAVLSCDIDTRLHEIARDLREWPPRVRFVCADILESKHVLQPALLDAWLTAEGRPRVVSNLPYGVATPFLANLLWEGVEFADALVLVQKEAAERFVAPVNTAAYGPLAIAVGLFAQAEIVRAVGPQVFWPPPRVESALLRLRPTNPQRARDLRALGLEDLLREVFTQRRKTLGKRLGQQRLREAGIDPRARPQEVEPEAWVRLLTVPPS